MPNTTPTTPAARIILKVDRDGWTKNLQLSINKFDENDHGTGYRLAGPKYNGSSTNLLRTELDERDTAEIRAMLDTVFPQPNAAPARQVLGTTDQRPALASTSTETSYRLEHRQTGTSEWQTDTPGIGARWSWASRTKADQRLSEARDRWPDYEHRLITITTTVTEAPTDQQPETAPASADLRDRIAQAIRDAACTGDGCDDTEEVCARKRVQPGMWERGILTEVLGTPEVLADAVLAGLPAPADRDAALDTEVSP